MTKFKTQDGMLTAGATPPPPKMSESESRANNAGGQGLYV